MSAARITSLLCASMACAAPAAAQETAPVRFVTEVRIPARAETLEAFAWRSTDSVMLDRATLQTLGIEIPASEADGPVALNAIPGLIYEEDAADASLTITCAAACYAPQVLFPADHWRPPAISRANGGYLNYDLNAQWLDGEETLIGGVGEAAMFGPWGLFETSALAQSGARDDVTRLETRWTMDFPAEQLRLRIGDSSTLGALGAPVRFAGVQLGRHFALAPSFITYPTPTLASEAQAASTVELYVDGALRARERVNTGPFVFENAPLVSGAGQAQLVVTDVLGRSEIINRPFFVSASMLRPGLSDWSAALGAERLDYGRDSATYGDAFLSGRYRRGLTNAITAEGAVELTESTSATQLGAAIAAYKLGQLRLAHTIADGGAWTDASWHRDARVWSFGLQWQGRDKNFDSLGQSDTNLRSSAAANLGVDLGNAGTVGFTAAEVRFFDDAPARTLTLSYTPDIRQGALSFRLLYTEREESELAFGVTFSMPLRGDISAQAGADIERRGTTYHASAQSAADTRGGIGWRARAALGEDERADLALDHIGSAGDSFVQVAHTRRADGVRAGHTGSVGWIESHTFAARRIQSAFAMIDVGEQDVSVSRDRLPIGATGRNGRLIAVNLRPYDLNTIAIAPDDLPLDRAPATTETQIAPAAGAGVVVRFPQARAALTESRVQRRQQGPDLRGDVLVRQRDGARFPIGSDGRIVILGAAPGDIVRLDSDARCTARADSEAVADGLMLRCAA